MSYVTTIHHLNCGSFTLPQRRQLVTHVLLCETREGLVLVDAGIGTPDIAAPWSSLGVVGMAMRPALSPTETAVAQVRSLGYDPADVRHIVATHLDYDHIGGAQDFPDAIVHTTTVELDTAQQRSKLTHKLRYRQPHLTALGRIKDYNGAGEPLLGFERAYQVSGVDGFWLVPMPGHTPGHACVAVRAGTRGWVLHAGDAFLDRSALDPTTVAPKLISGLEHILADDPTRLGRNHARLEELAVDDGIAVDIVCSHDKAQFDAMTAMSGRSVLLDDIDRRPTTPDVLDQEVAQ